MISLPKVTFLVVNFHWLVEKRRLVANREIVSIIIKKEFRDKLAFIK